MSAGGLGPVGGLAANRPIVVTLVIAFGLVALSAVGMQTGASDAARESDFLISIIALTSLPLAIAATAPREFLLRALLVCAVAALLAGLDFAAPRLGVAPPPRFPAIAAAIVLVLALLLLAADALGALIRFSFLGTLAAALGVAGLGGLMAIRQAGGDAAGPLASLVFALGGAVVAGAIANFAHLFARGADSRRAAGVAARYAAAPLLYAIVLGAAAGFVVALENNGPASASELAWITGAGALFTAGAGLFATAGALALRRASERIAVEENERQQAFRRFWRPLRRALAPSASLAFVAVIAVLTVAAAFNLIATLSPFEMLFLIVASAAGGLLFLSLRTGAFLLFALVSGALLVTWGRQLMGSPLLAPIDFVAAMGFAAALYAQIGVAWRDARSPRLNARETTEAAISDGAPSFVLSAIVGAASFLAADAAGVWPDGGKTAVLVAVLALYGLVIAPPALTALSHSVRRELA
ncbi:MAG: hypothetical protein GC153_00210 [Alphaproteobacteria bacterium]|nr:hypothetical protein [Alphaproteobacteria bacterium]